MIVETLHFEPGERWGRYRDTEYLISSRARVYSTKSGRMLRPYRDRNNRGEEYLRVTLIHEGRRMHVYLHRAVAELHVPGYVDGAHAHHKRQPPYELESNFAEHLEWQTPTEHWQTHRGDGAPTDHVDLPYIEEDAPF